MKKRILSLCLLLAMVVTALPLAALTVFAAGGSTSYDEDDYNALYVQDSLVWAVDFFDTNTDWGGAAETLTGAAAVKTAITDRVWHDTSGGAITPVVSFNSAVTSITLKNGYLPTNDLGKEGGEVQIKGLHTYADIVGGSTADMVMAVPSAINFAYNNICFAFTPTLSKVNAAFKNDGAYYSLSGISPSVSWSNNTPAGVTLLLSSPVLASNGIWWNTKATYSYEYIGTYLKDNEGNFVLDGDGNKIISVTATTGSILTYYAPKGGLKTVTTDYVDGVKQEAAAEYPNVYIPEDHLVPGTLALYQNGALSYAAPEGTPIFPDTTYTVADQNYWKVSWQTGATMYASRYYNRTLTPGEIAQNHFADLAKWFRLDVSAWSFVPEDLRQQAYKAVVGYTFTSDPAKIQEDIDEVFAAYYTGFALSDDEKEDDDFKEFMKVAEVAQLNLDVINNLNGDGRADIVKDFVEIVGMNSDYEPVVYRSVYDLLVENLTAMTFVGYQVRIDTGAPSQNYAGVRAVFDVDTALIERLVRATGKSVTISAGIESGDVRRATISFTYSLVGDELTCVGENRIFGAGEEGADLVVPAYTYERAEGVTSFNYVVTYKGDDVTAADYAEEYTYAYDITIGEDNHSFSVKTKSIGNEISAYEIYSLFAELDAYKDDAMVKAVVSAVAE